mmetsp:Transcript_9002/g.22325  ORF Transcript_9002/g.22325 Transcript_9002/m.22325 type:complete len:253 (-) Transcript_9002:1114-1872(-)
MMTEPRRCHELPLTTWRNCVSTLESSPESSGVCASSVAQLFAAFDKSGCWLEAAVTSTTGRRFGKWRVSTCARPCSIEKVINLIKHSRAARADPRSASSSGSRNESEGLSLPPGWPTALSSCISRGTRHWAIRCSMKSVVSACSPAASSGHAGGCGSAAWSASASRQPTSSRTCLYGCVAHVRITRPRSNCRMRGRPFQESSTSSGARKRSVFACARDVSVDVELPADRSRASSAACTSSSTSHRMRRGSRL